MKTIKWDEYQRILCELAKSFNREAIQKSGLFVVSSKRGYHVIKNRTEFSTMFIGKLISTYDFTNINTDKVSIYADYSTCESYLFEWNALTVRQKELLDKMDEVKYGEEEIESYAVQIVHGMVVEWDLDYFLENFKKHKIASSKFNFNVIEITDKRVVVKFESK